MFETADHAVDPTRDELTRLARHALRAVRGGIAGADRPAAPRPALLAQLHAAALDRDPGRLDTALASFAEARVPRTEIIDHYLPQVARDLGAAWCDDTLDFAGVSLGCARLHALLRRLDDHWGVPPDGGFGRALVIVPAGAQHTLGASVLTHQLRRAGVATTLALDTGADALARMLRRAPPQAVLISASLHEPLETLRVLTDIARTTAGQRPVLIGGNITELGQDVQRITGADHIGTDFRAALPYLARRVAA